VVTLQIPSLAPITGVVDYRRGAFLGIRTDDALYRSFGRNAFGMPVGTGHHLFAEGADPETEQQVWSSWLSGVFAVV
jgi:hypothetical protein